MVSNIPTGQSVKMVSSTLEVHPNRLYRWIQEYKKYGERAFQNRGALFVMPKA
ncbi:transposase [Streptococcus mutans]|nr:transposase [Streptococcus mutans]